MIANAQDNTQTLVLVLRSRKQIYALNPIALTRAQATKQELIDDYQDAFVLDRRKGLQQIERIEVIGPWGGSIGRQLLSRLTSAWQISVKLSEPLLWSLDEVKRLLVDCIQVTGLQNVARDEGARQVDTIAAVRSAANVAEIFDALNLPPPDDALDVL